MGQPHRYGERCLEQPAITRKLAAIVAADVVGYSRMMGIDEVGTLNALKAVRREVVDPVIAAHRGRIFKTNGDGLLVEFASAVDAVACAVAVQRAMFHRNSRIAPDRQIVFRMGINVGDVILDGDDVFGDGVNVAARLETLCEPGGVCISRSANDQVRDKLAIAFADLGEQTVKNIARAIGVFGLAASDIAAMPLVNVDEANSQVLPSHVLPPPPPAPRRWPAVAAMGALLAAGAGVAWWLPRPVPPLPPAPSVTIVAAPPSVPKIPEPAVPSASSFASDELFWNSIQARNNPAELRTYLDRFPTGVFRDLAQARLDKLAAVTASTAAPGDAARLQAELEAALDSMNVTGSKELATAYAALTGASKALAAVPGTSAYWRVNFSVATPDVADTALEKCQIVFTEPCVLVATGNQPLRRPDSGWPRRDMPRVTYSGLFDPAQIPGIRQQARESQGLKDYIAFKGPKAMVINPENGYHYALGKTTQHDADESAFANCRDATSRVASHKLCFLYAEGDQVVFSRRLIATPPP